jgi:tRNA (Thr-GGU) A37 N-methylase
VAVTASSVGLALMAWAWHKRQMQHTIEQWQARRQEERTGRIRAEVKLRTLIKEQQQHKQQQSASDSSSPNNNNNNNSMTLTCIATVVSPFTKRMGTPRQSQVVPSSRGYLQFTIPSSCLDGILEYSHVWILFAFHANTNILLPMELSQDTTRNIDVNTHKKKQQRQKQKQPRTKIRPPRAGGQSVGQLATRSPHRPNPLGLSLVRVTHWDARLRQLHVSGLDLVHGTPVYDVKPCVPWDIPGYTTMTMSSAATTNSSDHGGTETANPTSNENVNCTNPWMNVLQAPDWVWQDDRLAAVEFTDAALASLRTLVMDQGRLLPWYAKNDEGVQTAQQTLKEILAQDPRSSHKGQAVHARGSTAPTTDYHIVLGQLRIGFIVSDNYHVVVRTVDPVDFAPESYVDGIPLVATL